MDEPTHVGCLIEVRPIGAITAEQTENWKTETNDRLLGVAVQSYNHEGATSLRDFNKTLVDPIKEFFVSDNKQRGKRFKVTGTGGAKKANYANQKGSKAHRNNQQASEDFGATILTSGPVTYGTMPETRQCFSIRKTRNIITE